MLWSGTGVVTVL